MSEEKNQNKKPDLPLIPSTEVTLTQEDIRTYLSGRSLPPEKMELALNQLDDPQSPLCQAAEELRQAAEFWLNGGRRRENGK